MPDPTISVIMPFYNNGPTVRQAAVSMLKQSFTDLELIAVDDGSTDDGYARMAELRDPRIRLLRNETNLGCAGARNLGMDVARGEFIAPMDADDTCYRHRLRACLDMLRTHPDWAACGGWARMVGWGTHPYTLRFPCDPSAVRAYWLFGTPFVHCAMLLRKSTLMHHGIAYGPSLRSGDDYDLLLRLGRRAPIGNVPAVLQRYTRNASGISVTQAREVSRARLKGVREELSMALGRDASEEEVQRHASLGNGAGVSSDVELAAAADWFQQLETANHRTRVYDSEGLRAASAMVWFRVCRNSAHLGRAAWRAWTASPLRGHYAPAWAERLGFLGSRVLGRLMPARRRPQGDIIGL